MYSRIKGWISSWHQQPCVVNQEDILRHILTYARDPRHSLVCKLWSETTNNWVYALTLEVYRNHKLMSLFTVSIPKGISQDDCKAEIQKIYFKVNAYAYATQNRPFFTQSATSSFAPLDLIPIVEKLAAADLHKVCKASSKETQDLFPLDLKWVGAHQNNLATVTLLSLNNGNISILPSQIVLFTNLQELNCESNHLTMLPPEIGRLIHLKKFYLRSNQLSSLPPEIGKLTNLKLLDLSWNQLTTLPPQIFLCTQLTELGLWANQMERIYFHLLKLHQELKKASLQEPNNSCYGKNTFDFGADVQESGNSIGTDNMLAIKRSCLENSFNKLETALTDQNKDLLAGALKEVEMVDPVLRQKLGAISLSEPGSFKKEAWLDLYQI